MSHFESDGVYDNGHDDPHLDVRAFTKIAHTVESVNGPFHSHMYA